MGITVPGRFASAGLRGRSGQSAAVLAGVMYVSDLFECDQMQRRAWSSPARRMTQSRVRLR